MPKTVVAHSSKLRLPNSNVNLWNCVFHGVQKHDFKYTQAIAHYIKLNNFHDRLMSDCTDNYKYNSDQ